MLYYRPFSSTVSAGGSGWAGGHQQWELRPQRSLLQGQHPLGVAFVIAEFPPEGPAVK